MKIWWMVQKNLRERIVLLAMIAAIPSGVLASERAPGLSSGFNLGTGGVFSGDFGIGLSGRAFIEYAPYIHEIALKLTGGYLRFEDDVTIGIAPYTSKQNVVFENAYLTGGVIYRFSRGKIVPFATGNLGVYRYYKDELFSTSGPIIDGQQVSPYNAVREREGYAFGLNAGGGVEFFTGRSSSISIEGLCHAIFGEADDQVWDISAMFRFFPGK